LTTQLLNSLMLSYLTSQDSNKNKILAGDFNSPDIDWTIYSGSSSLADDFSEFAYNHNLTQCVIGPTHCSGNILDIVLSNINSLCHADMYSSLPPGLSSDHYMIAVHIGNSPNRPTRIHKQRFDCNNACWEDMNQFFSQYDFALALYSSNTKTLNLSGYTLKRLLTHTKDLH